MRVRVLAQLGQRDGIGWRSLIYLYLSEVFQCDERVRYKIRGAKQNLRRRLIRSSEMFDHSQRQLNPPGVRP